jgi:nucleotide-binding universal stress UspA family protein
MTGIIVGVDGSKQSLRAVDWAADEAVRRNASLRVLYVITPWLFDVPVDPRAGAMRAWMLHGGDDIVGYAVGRAGERAPGLEVSGEQIGGQAAETLVDRARDALMLVVGSRGRGGVGGLLLGSVAFQVSSHARCPAVVVRDAPSDEIGEVVLGVDGSPASAEAVGFAFQETSVRGARLHAVLVVGSRGRGGFTGLLLGSVGHAMLHRARCPVAVVAPG